METENARIARELPLAMYQHAVVEVLDAYALQQHKIENGDGLLTAMMDPLDSIQAKDILIPKPLFDYISSIRKTVTPTGETIRVNLPRIVIPQGPIAAHLPVAACEAGSFGQPTADSHNAYECYWSPLITKQLIDDIIRANGPARNAFGHNGTHCRQDLSPLERVLPESCWDTTYPNDSQLMDYNGW